MTNSPKTAAALAEAIEFARNAKLIDIVERLEKIACQLRTKEECKAEAP